MSHLAQYFPITDPTLVFLVVLLVILFAPIVMGKLRIPHIIGLVLAGAALGEHGFNILALSDGFKLFGQVGLFYIMFLASLEMDLEGLRKHGGRIGVFGLLSFLLPFALVFMACFLWLGYGASTSLLLSCIMSSNTLIAYPIISRYGLQRKPSVTLSVGATMISLFLSLLVLAAIVNSYDVQGQAWSFWLLFTLKFALYCGLIIWMLPRLARWFLRSYSDAVMQFIFVLSLMFVSAALSEVVGLEGIFGAFFAGLILNRYIPRLSPLMNRIEFIGNAIFIPFFLIYVGMLINLRMLFQGSGILVVMLVLVVAGTAGKALASYLMSFFCKLPKFAGDMMLGLTSAHAAGAIAMAMVGMSIALPGGRRLISSDTLNAIVVMILITCIISSVITENASRNITLRDKEIVPETGEDDEKILVPVKYPEYAERLMNLAMLMRNEKLRRSVVALNVVYDDEKMTLNQEQGRRLLDQVSRYAASGDVHVQTQVRVAANIANGIKHAFKEFRASEIIIGMHMHENVSPRFWGQFQQSLFNGLNCQIIFARLMQPLNTLRRIIVAVPSRAEFEPGFYRWLERLARLCGNLECLVRFHGRQDTLGLIHEFYQNKHPDVRAEYVSMAHWNELPQLAQTIAHDHLLVVVTARKGTVSYKNAQERLPEEIKRFFKGRNLMIIFPDQFGYNDDLLTFAQPQHTEERSAYEELGEWLRSLPPTPSLRRGLPKRPK